jgi:hypothetical protein
VQRVFSRGDARARGRSSTILNALPWRRRTRTTGSGWRDNLDGIDIAARDCTGVACSGNGFESVLRREDQVGAILFRKAQRGRIGRSDGYNWPWKGRACLYGRREDVGGLSPPTDADLGLAGLYAPASESEDGACRLPPPATVGDDISAKIGREGGLLTGCTGGTAEPKGCIYGDSARGKVRLSV